MRTSDFLTILSLCVIFFPLTVDAKPTTKPPGKRFCDGTGSRNRICEISSSNFSRAPESSMPKSNRCNRALPRKREGSGANLCNKIPLPANTWRKPISGVLILKRARPYCRPSRKSTPPMQSWDRQLLRFFARWRILIRRQRALQSKSKSISWQQIRGTRKIWLAAGGESQAESRLLTLATRPKFRDMIDRETQKPGAASGATMAAVLLRVRVLEVQNRKPELASYLDSVVSGASTIEQAAEIENLAQQKSLEAVRQHALEKQAALASD